MKGPLGARWGRGRIAGRAAALLGEGLHRRDHPDVAGTGSSLSGNRAGIARAEDRGRASTRARTVGRAPSAQAATGTGIKEESGEAEQGKKQDRFHWGAHARGAADRCNLFSRALRQGREPDQRPGPRWEVAHLQYEASRLRGHRSCTPASPAHPGSQRHVPGSEWQSAKRPR